MGAFNYRNGHFFAEDVNLRDVVVRYGTPCYVYSRADLESHYQAFDSAYTDVSHQIFYAVKANSNLAVLDVLARLGSGFDIVSGGELERVLAAGGIASKTIFSGVGKSSVELSRALAVGIGGFNVESEAELDTLETIARKLGKVAPVSLRVNPDVNPNTHPHIATGLKGSKFGIPFDMSKALYVRASRSPYLRMDGIGCHIGSQITSIDPFVEAITRVMELVQELRAEGVNLQSLNLGGGLGIRYKDEIPPMPSDHAAAILPIVRYSGLTLSLEPGRAIVGNAGILLTRVLYVKFNGGKKFVVVDAAMNDLLRPALYNGWHEILPVTIDRTIETAICDVVGPVCESADFLGKSRSLRVEQGGILAVRSVGAYGFSMSSNYNTRPRAAEIMADGGLCHLIRAREVVHSLYANEARLP